ncbi:MAG: EF-P beta-lysylation protein EpmB [Leptospiraceae bacterium]|nr:EF-P beta-lysylation protein EpmB [Leptospiraceae bacterium]MCP5493146.1 EF-P beta-lysylation protein EpmB [Leptospiraceae bacterium]
MTTEESFTPISNLLKLLNIEHILDEVDKNSFFPLKVPSSFVDKIEKNNPDDPLLKQILPLKSELENVDGFTPNPVQETEFMPAVGVLHKYYGRALVIVTQKCSIHCRYCFRKHFPYSENNAEKEQWKSAIEYIKSDTSISEVILSGGDPFSISDAKLSYLLEKINEISHIEFIRFHTRFLPTIPNRITDNLIKILEVYSNKISIIFHINHPNEIDEKLAEKVKLIRNTGIIVFNQSVLLHSVNDNIDILSNLSKKLYKSGIVPYYLHFLDKVQGASEFFVSENIACELISQMRKTLPGYLIPRLVRENAGDMSKEYMPINSRLTKNIG